ncbi:MAG: hypothetical protein GX318_08125 [Clostridia bacterium]|nr:hypothetical protein [Clostridia bacterium]
MKRIHIIDIANGHHLKTIAASLTLSGLGLLFLFLTSNIIWLGDLSLGSMLLVFFGAVIFAAFIHSQYQLFCSRLLGFRCEARWGLLSPMVVGKPTPKWESLGMLLAPLVDLTILLLLILNFLPSILNPFLTAVLVSNLVLSGDDLVLAIYIFKFADKGDFVKFTREGCEIWT